MTRWLGATAVLAAASTLSVAASAAPADIVVRVLSEGGKYVGSSMGGASVVVRDALSGAVLAQGVTAGSTGDTRRIMDGGKRGTRLADDQSAAFRAQVEIEAPRLVEIEVVGPLAQRQSAVRVTAQRWLLPGQQVHGDGWVMELPGLVVDVVAPAAHQRIKAGADIPLSVNVALMCGCPIEPGGLWDSARFDVQATISHDGRPAGTVPLSYGGRTGLFTGRFRPAGSGSYVITLSAVDTMTGATGVDATSVIIP